MRYVVYAGYLSHGYIFDPYIVAYTEDNHLVKTLIGHNADNVLPIWIFMVKPL